MTLRQSRFHEKIQRTFRTSKVPATPIATPKITCKRIGMSGKYGRVAGGLGSSAVALACEENIVVSQVACEPCSCTDATRFIKHFHRVQRCCTRCGGATRICYLSLGVPTSRQLHRFPPLGMQHQEGRTTALNSFVSGGERRDPPWPSWPGAQTHRHQHRAWGGRSWLQM